MVCCWWTAITRSFCAVCIWRRLFERVEHRHVFLYGRHESAVFPPEQTKRWNISSRFTSTNELDIRNVWLPPTTRANLSSPADPRDGPWLAGLDLWPLSSSVRRLSDELWKQTRHVDVFNLFYCYSWSVNVAAQHWWKITSIIFCYLCR